MTERVPKTHKKGQRKASGPFAVPFIIFYIVLEHQHSHQPHQEGADPGHDTLVHHHNGGPLTAKFPLDCGHSRNAGGVQQAEHQQGSRLGRGQSRRQGGGGTKEDQQGGHHALLGHKAGDEGRGHPPVRKAQRGEQRGDVACNAGQDAVLRVGRQAELQVKVLQEPDDDGGRKDDRKGFLQEVAGLFPQQLGHVFQAGQAVVGHRLSDFVDR